MPRSVLSDRTDAWTSTRVSLGPVLCILTVLASIAMGNEGQKAGRSAGRTPRSRPATQPATRPANLAVNGDFEQPDESGKLPAGWITKRPRNVRRMNLGGERGWVVEMTGDNPLMGTYGTDLTGGLIEFEPNTRYRCTGYARSDGPNMKVFVKGYATIKRRNKGRIETLEDVVYQMRKDLEPSKDWKPFNLDFDVTPAAVFSDHQHRVQYLRITLWAYWPRGTCWFDDIRFEEVGPVADHHRRHYEPVTHVGLPPRLADDKDAARTGREPFDEQQAWLDAANALRGGRYEESSKLARQLIAHAPAKGIYRVLAARALAKLERWAEADEHARWILERKEDSETGGNGACRIEPWQVDWANVVHAEVLWRTGRPKEARKILEQLKKTSAASPHARTAAEKLLATLDDGAD